MGAPLFCGLSVVSMVNCLWRERWSTCGETDCLPAGRPDVCLREDRTSACGKTERLPAGRPNVCLRGDRTSACGENSAVRTAHQSLRQICLMGAPFLNWRNCHHNITAAMRLASKSDAGILYHTPSTP